MSAGRSSRTPGHGLLRLEPARDLDAPEHARDERVCLARRVGVGRRGGATAARGRRRRARRRSARRRGARRRAGRRRAARRERAAAPSEPRDQRQRLASSTRRLPPRSPSRRRPAMASRVVGVAEDGAAGDEHARARLRRRAPRSSGAMPPSISRSIGRPRARRSSARMARTLGSTSGMNDCPPKPGLTLITRTRSATSSTYSMRAPRASTG